MTVRAVVTKDLHPLVAKVRSSPPPIAQLIGFELETVEQGHAVALLDAGPQHETPMGTVHGGILCDLADAAMGMAFASTLAFDASFATINLTINFLRPFWSGRLRADANVVTRGKSVGYIECEILNQDGKPVAKVSSTCLVLPGAQRKQF